MENGNEEFPDLDFWTGHHYKRPPRVPRLASWLEGSMKNNGDSTGNEEFQLPFCSDDHSMKNNEDSTGNEEFHPHFFPEDHSMDNNGYSTGNEEFQLSWPEDHLRDSSPYFSSGASDRGGSGTASRTHPPRMRRKDGQISDAILRKRETDKAYRQRSKATQEKIKEERDKLKAENEQLKLEIGQLKCKIQETDELMKSSLETLWNEIQDKNKQMESLAENCRLKLENLELEKMVMKTEVGRLEAEKKLLQKELAIANQSSETQP